MTQVDIGSLVQHPTKPEWGPAKVIHTRGDYLFVFFRDEPAQAAKQFRREQLSAASVQNDAVLDNLPPFVEKNGQLVLAVKPESATQARQRFLRRFPGGFSDPEYSGSLKEGERVYKWAAHERFVLAFGKGRGHELVGSSSTSELARGMAQVLGGARNLLAKTENIAFREGLEDESAARRYFSTLFDLLDVGPVEAAFMAHADAAGSLPTSGATNTEKWTIATLGPFIGRPDLFMFVKPQITKAAAAKLAFDILYDPKPNWTTYDAVLRMSKLYMDQLADLDPRDFIDVQSFFWVTGETNEKTRADKEVKRARKKQP